MSSTLNSLGHIIGIPVALWQLLYNLKHPDLAPKNFIYKTIDDFLSYETKEFAEIDQPGEELKSQPKAVQKLYRSKRKIP